MAVTGHIKIDITGTERARLLIQEMTELETELVRIGQRDLAHRIEHALQRFVTVTAPDDTPEDDDNT